MTQIHGETVEEIKKETVRRMTRSVNDLGRAMASIRTGRASIALLDSIAVDYYGTLTPLSQMASLATPTSTTLTIQPWDISQIGMIERAIRMSDLGINPANDGKIIRLVIPPLTKERRRILVRQLHKVVEQHRVAVRNIRREANEAVKRLEKAKAISEDDRRTGLAEIQRLTNDSVKDINKAGLVKEKEILEIR
ncbi:MAG: ribosome recycling factor [Bryobacterales bacterium]|nr:ribosome recycling factor [Bryobacterales bacterium]MDE0626118.1 ribosome recycling factor [Bryobacterales bacterium]